MSQIDDLLTSAIKEQHGCILSRQIEERLDEASQASLDRAMKDPKKFSNPMLYEVLTQMGFEIGKNIVQKHRHFVLKKPDQCACQKKA